MKLNILSDLHLSQGALPLPDNDADVVILAGDIARPARAMEWAAGFARPVLYVPGNHEFYGGSIPDRLAELKRLAIGTEVRILADDALVIDGVRFLGTTLWSDFALFGDGERRAAAIGEALRLVYDFSRIRTGASADALFTPDGSAALFAAHSEWLRARFSEPHAGPTVVVTHHAPSAQSIHPRFSDSLLNPCFVSRAEPLVEASRAQLWIHGHTHDSFDYVLHGTRVVCNPRGYAKDGVNENPHFDADFTIEIDTAATSSTQGTGP